MVRTMGTQLGTMSPQGEVDLLNGSSDMGGIMRTLNALGRDGWQLVNVVVEQSVYWLKRRLA
jgi:hypothetical protein